MTVTIEEIIFVENHPNADGLSVYQVGSVNPHSVVSMKNEDGSHRFRQGELVVYVPENSIIPQDLLESTGFWNEEKNKGYLGGSKGNRVTNRKIRDVLSEGLIWKIDDVNSNNIPDVNGLERYLNNLITEYVSQ